MRLGEVIINEAGCSQYGVFNDSSVLKMAQM